MILWDFKGHVKALQERFNGSEEFKDVLGALQNVSCHLRSHLRAYHGDFRDISLDPGGVFKVGSADV